MTIKFVCGCGKRLKARDEMAERRSVCPRCGSPVGIPPLKPRFAGADGPLTVLDRLHRSRSRTQADNPPDTPDEDGSPFVLPPVNTWIVRLLSARGQRQPDLASRHLEQHWYECLLYPVRAWPFCLLLSVYAAVLSSAGALLVPRLLTAPSDNPVFVLLGVLLLVLLVGVPFSFLERVLASAVLGEVYYIHWSGRPLLTFLISVGKWLACFAAGPGVFAGTAFFYWLWCGDPSLLDWLILIELGVVAAAYQVFALLAVTDRQRLRDLNPVAVVDLVHRLRWRALVAPAAGLLLLAHGWLLVAGVAMVHTEMLAGWAMLAGGWGSGMFWGTFFCRLLGVWCHRSRQMLET